MFVDKTFPFLLTVCDDPHLYVQTPSFETTCAFLHGYDHALGGAPLEGFREWLLAEGRLDFAGGEWRNYFWWMVFRRSLFPDQDVHGTLSADDSARALTELKIALEEFLEVRRRGRLQLIYHRYLEWLKKRTDTSAVYYKECLGIIAPPGASPSSSSSAEHHVRKERR